jgi:elongation factor P hydroxylase
VPCKLGKKLHYLTDHDWILIDHLNYSFSTSALKLAEQPTPDRPQIGASSLFDNVQVETEEKLAKQEKKVTEKEVSFYLIDSVIRINIFVY